MCTRTMAGHAYRSWVISFIIWITASGAVFAVEWFYVTTIIRSSSELFIFINALTLAASLGSRQYCVMRKRTGSGPSDWRIQSAILDDALSRQYSEEGHNILGREIEIYRIFDQHFSRALSPAFSIRGKTPRIFVFGSFFASLDQDEREALIIHELGHYLYRDLTVTYLLTLLFTISLGGLLITFALVLLFGGINQFLTHILISFSAVSFSFLIALQWHLAGQEYRADRLAVELKNENKSIKGVLQKSCSYLRMHFSQNKLRRIETLCLKRLKHLRDHGH